MSSFVSKISFAAGAASVATAVHSLTKFIRCNQCQKLIDVVQASLNSASVQDRFNNVIQSVGEVIPMEQLQEMGNEFLTTGEMPLTPCFDFIDVTESDLGCGKYLIKTMLATALVAGCVGLYCYSRKPARHPLANRLHDRPVRQQAPQNRATPLPPARAPIEWEHPPRANHSSAPLERTKPAEDSDAEKQQKLEKEWAAIKRRWDK